MKSFDASSRSDTTQEEAASSKWHSASNWDVKPSGVLKEDESSLRSQPPPPPSLYPPLAGESFHEKQSGRFYHAFDNPDYHASTGRSGINSKSAALTPNAPHSTLYHPKSYHAASVRHPKNVITIGKGPPSKQQQQDPMVVSPPGDCAVPQSWFVAPSVNPRSHRGRFQCGIGPPSRMRFPPAPKLRPMARPMSFDAGDSFNDDKKLRNDVKLDKITDSFRSRSRSPEGRLATERDLPFKQMRYPRDYKSISKPEADGGATRSVEESAGGHFVPGPPTVPHDSSFPGPPRNPGEDAQFNRGNFKWTNSATYPGYKSNELQNAQGERTSGNPFLTDANFPSFTSDKLEKEESFGSVPMTVGTANESLNPLIRPEFQPFTEAGAFRSGSDAGSDYKRNTSKSLFSPSKKIPSLLSAKNVDAASSPFANPEQSMLKNAPLAGSAWGIAHAANPRQLQGSFSESGVAAAFASKSATSDSLFQALNVSRDTGGIGAISAPSLASVSNDSSSGLQQKNKDTHSVPASALSTLFRQGVEFYSPALLNDLGTELSGSRIMETFRAAYGTPPLQNIDISSLLDSGYLAQAGEFRMSQDPHKFDDFTLEELSDSSEDEEGASSGDILVRPPETYNPMVTSITFETEPSNFSILHDGKEAADNTAAISYEPEEGELMDVEVEPPNPGFYMTKDTLIDNEMAPHAFGIAEMASCSSSNDSAVKLVDENNLKHNFHPLFSPFGASSASVFAEQYRGLYDTFNSISESAMGLSFHKSEVQTSTAFSVPEQAGGSFGTHSSPATITGGFAAPVLGSVGSVTFDRSQQELLPSGRPQLLGAGTLPGEDAYTMPSNLAMTSESPVNVSTGLDLSYENFIIPGPLHSANLNTIVNVTGDAISSETLPIAATAMNIKREPISTSLPSFYDYKIAIPGGAGQIEMGDIPSKLGPASQADSSVVTALVAPCVSSVEPNLRAQEVLQSSGISVQLPSPKQSSRLSFTGISGAKQLVLLLDLDNTLLNAAALTKLQCTINLNHFLDCDGYPEMYKFELPSHKASAYYMKLRPYLRRFLQELEPYYEMCVYTNAAKDYADVVISMLDPDRRLFGSRIVAREDASQRDVGKTVRRLYPNIDIRRVIAFDDRKDIWEDLPHDQVLKAEHYDFFEYRRGKLMESYPRLGALATSNFSLRERVYDYDMHLHYAAKLLVKIHQQCMSSPEDIPCVGTLLNKLQRETLATARICFTGFRKTSINVPSADCEEWQRDLAAKHGATVLPSLDSPGITHLVSGKCNTTKYELCRRPEFAHVKKVHTLWLYDCISTWELTNESYFNADGLCHQYENQPPLEPFADHWAVRRREREPLKDCRCAYTESLANLIKLDLVRFPTMVERVFMGTGVYSHGAIVYSPFEKTTILWDPKKVSEITASDKKGSNGILNSQVAVNGLGEKPRTLATFASSNNNTPWNTTDLHNSLRLQTSSISDVSLSGSDSLAASASIRLHHTNSNPYNLISRPLTESKWFPTTSPLLGEKRFSVSCPDTSGAAGGLFSAEDVSTTVQHHNSAAFSATSASISQSGSIELISDSSEKIPGNSSYLQPTVQFFPLGREHYFLGDGSNADHRYNSHDSSPSMSDVASSDHDHSAVQAFFLPQGSTGEQCDASNAFLNLMASVGGNGRSPGTENTVLSRTHDISQMCSDSAVNITTTNLGRTDFYSQPGSSIGNTVTGTFSSGTVLGVPSNESSGWVSHPLIGQSACESICHPL